MICKSLNSKNIFDEFCILFWINRLNCHMTLNMSEKGSIHFTLGWTRSFGFHKSSQRFGGYLSALSCGFIWREGKVYLESSSSSLKMLQLALSSSTVKSPFPTFLQEAQLRESATAHMWLSCCSSYQMTSREGESPIWRQKEKQD